MKLWPTVLPRNENTVRSVRPLSREMNTGILKEKTEYTETLDFLKLSIFTSIAICNKQNFLRINHAK